jgi:hypothetical protein
LLADEGLWEKEGVWIAKMNAAAQKPCNTEEKSLFIAED